jgi:phosphoglycolate phosphatase
MLLESGAAPLSFETVRSCMGKGVPNLIRHVLEASTVAALGEQPAMVLFHRHYRATNGRFGQVFAGVREGLQVLHQARYRLACVTNKALEPATELLEMHGLAPWFEVVIAGDSLALHACHTMAQTASAG